MTNSNEFKGTTLAEAVRKATAAYKGYEYKDQRVCNSLLRQYVVLQSEANSVASKADQLKREADRLRGNARDLAIMSAFSALGGVVAALKGMSAAIRIIQRKSLKNLTRSELDRIVTSAGTAGAAFGVVRALQDYDKADDLVDEAEDVAIEAISLAGSAQEALDAFDDAGCNVSGGFGV